MGTLFRDILYSLRGLAKRPGYTAVAVLTLALGVGANTAIFSAINALLLKPLPFHNPQELTMVYLKNAGASDAEAESQPWSYPKYEVLRDNNRSFAQVAAFSKQDFALTDTDNPERLTAEVVSASYFPLLGVSAESGHVFDAADDKMPNERPVVLIGRELWQRRFSSDPNIVGQRIFINKTPLTVVGVMPSSFHGLSGNAEVWIPTMMAPTLLAPDELTEPFVHWHDVIGRLKPGVTREQAQEEMKTIARALNEAIPSPPGFESGDVNLVALKDAKIDPTMRKSFLILFIAVIFVLLIACVNSANLLLARSLSRQKEIAIRLALGATRSHIIRLLLVESVLIGLIGGALGLLMAVWGIRLLNAIRPANNPAQWARNFQVLDLNVAQLDSTVLVFNFAIAILVGLLFGLLPALKASKPDINNTLKDVASGTAESFGKLRRIGPRSLLVISEVALSFVLLVGAGLMLRSFGLMQSTKIGFDPGHVLTMKFDLASYQGPAATAFCQQLLSRVSTLPGVRSASVSQSTPLSTNSGSTELTILERPQASPGTGPSIDYHVVGSDYFKTLSIQLIKGRSMTEQDREGTPKVALINETAARKLWPGEDPIGKRVRLSLGWKPDESAEIIGIVGDVKYDNIEVPVKPDLYLSYLQDTQKPSFILLRTDGDPNALVQPVRSQILALNKDLPVYDIKTMDQRVADVTSRTHLSAILLGLFSGVALVLSAIGIYGLMSYAVSERRKEFAIRMALGASPKHIIKLIIGNGMLLAVVGVAAGLFAAFALTRVLASQLYGVTSTDPLTFLGVSLLLTIVALLACYIPAQKAARVDPLVTFNGE
jgi:putative ABC transport system permease protein